MVNFEFPDPDIQLDQLTVDQQHIIMKARQIGARNLFEEAAQNPDSGLDYERARDNKFLADQRLVDFEVANGFIKAPEQ
jgi:hypothetical protein